VLLAEREWLHARLADKPDVTLRGLLGELRARGVKVGHCGCFSSARRSASKNVSV
jgi:hypothetical protein